MTEQEILLSAANNTWPDGPLNMAQQLLWFKAREMYQAYFQGALPKEAGLKRKQTITAEYRHNNSQLSDSFQREKYLAHFWKALENSASNYAKHKSIENADAMYYAMYRMIPPDKPLHNEGGEHIGK